MIGWVSKNILGCNLASIEKTGYFEDRRILNPQTISYMPFIIKISDIIVIIIKSKL
jgi:hypothetical protein